MARYCISCKEVGFRDCEYTTEADTIEQVIEQCADHGREYHDLKGFGVELYRQMRSHIHRIETPQSPR